MTTKQPQDPIDDAFLNSPCPHCGSLKDTWFSRTEPMGFYCPDCGRDVDEGTESTAEPVSCRECGLHHGDHLSNCSKWGGVMPDPLYASHDNSETHICPHCKMGPLRWCHPYEPWSDGNWICGRCDSTFCDSAERPRPIITEKSQISPIMGFPAQEITGFHENPGFHEIVNCHEIVKLVREVLGILNETEESDSGNVFHPTTISSCRILKVGRLREIFGRLECILKQPSEGQNALQ